MNLNILNWNIRGINSSRKRQILKDHLSQHKIDIVLIQETKKENFSNRILKTISSKLDLWHWLPARGRSGGILFGGDSNKIKILACHLHRFCLDIHFENKIDSTVWQLTIVYGPVIRTLKKELWKELDRVRQDSTSMWVLCGDFNVLRHKSEKSGPHFDITTSSMFNSFISRHSLIEHKLETRKFTWTNGRTYALLDRIFTSLDWDTTYPTSQVQELSSFGSDHCPLLLHTSNTPSSHSHTFRFDSSWIDIDEFNRLIEKWWSEFRLDISNLGFSWNEKLKYMRRKIFGWTKNYYGQKKRDKASLLTQIHNLELIQEDRPLYSHEQE